MQITKNRVGEMDCAVIPQTSQNKSETVKNATKVVERRIEDLQTKREKERKQPVSVSWQEQER